MVFTRRAARRLRKRAVSSQLQQKTKLQMSLGPYLPDSVLRMSRTIWLKNRLHLSFTLYDDDHQPRKQKIVSYTDFFKVTDPLVDSFMRFFLQTKCKTQSTFNIEQNIYLNMQVAQWLAAQNEKSATRVRFPVVFITFIFQVKGITSSISKLWVKYQEKLSFYPRLTTSLEEEQY